MIFVSVGTHEAPFDRMLRAVYDLDLDEELVVQHGPSGIRHDRAAEAEFLSFDAVVDCIRKARAVVMHAGVGSVMISLANGKRPIVMARQREFGEHVDDHQLELARRLEASGLVTLVEDGDALAAALAGETQPAGQMNGVPWLGTDLSDYLADQLGAPPFVGGQTSLSRFPRGSA
jgi:UDP-N-acetylglucosamine transferase subunit ALG13